MNKRFIWLAGLGLALASIAPAQGQAQFPTQQAGQTAGGVALMCVLAGVAKPCDVTTPLQIAGTLSATIGGFAGNGSYANLTATGSSSASTALPTGTSVRITNTGTTQVSCTFATGAATGLRNNIQVAPSSSVSRVNGTYDHIACIDQGGADSTSNVVVLEGGSGLGNDSGGGGGAGGGGLSVAFAGAIGANGTPGGFKDGSGNFQSFLGDTTNGQWVNVKAATGLAQGSTTSGQTGSLVMGAVLTVPPTYTSAQTSPVSLTPEGALRSAATAVASGGASTTGNIAANNTTGVNLKGTPGTYYGVQLAGLGSVPAWLKLYDKATTPTCGTDTPIKRLLIPAAATAANGAGSNISFGPQGVKTASGLGYCITTGILDSDTGAPAANTYVANVDWQ